MKLRSLRKKPIEQKLEGKVYRWPKAGSVMTVTPQIGSWLLAKLNNKDSNPALKAEGGKPWLEVVEEQPGEQKDLGNVLVAELPPEPEKPPEQKPEQKPEHPAAPAGAPKK